MRNPDLSQTEPQSPLTPRSARIAGFFSGPFQEPKIEDFRAGIDEFIKSADAEYHENRPEKEIDPYPNIQIQEIEIKNVKARIYQTKSQELQPCILYFTGSAFLYPHLDWQKRNCLELTRLTGSVTISIQEPCPPEHPFPAGLNAAFSVLKEIFENGEKLGIDKENISLCGFSSGGGVAAVLARWARDNNIPIQRQIILSGFLNPSALDDHDPGKHWDGYGVSKDFLQWAARQYVPSPEMRKHPDVSPALEENLDGIAPATIVVGKQDPLYDQCQAYYEHLKAAGVEAEFIPLDKKIHEIFGPYGFFLSNRQNENPIEMAVKASFPRTNKNHKLTPRDPQPSIPKFDF